jgi:hypothetical protein
MPSAADVRASHPLTLRHLGEAFLQEYLAKGGGLPFVDHVNARFSQGSIPDRAARDLARFEAELARLRALPPLAPGSGPLPPDDAPLVLSPHVALIMYGADLQGMLASLSKGEPATPRPRRNWFLLLPRGGDVDVRHLEREEGWMLEWFRAPTPLSEVMGMLEERAGVEALWREGLLARA